MGFFSGIVDTVKDVAKGIGSVVGAVADPVSSVMGVLSPFMEQQSASASNALSAEEAQKQRDWQAHWNLYGMDRAGLEHQKARDFNAEWAQKSMDFTAGQNRQAMDFSERMANTQHQRAVADLRAAGLNPILAATQGGAAAPQGMSGSGTSATSPSGTGGVGGGASAQVRPTFSAQSVASAAQASLFRANLAQVAAQTDNIRADTLAKLENPALIRAQTGTEMERLHHVRAGERKTTAEARLLEESRIDTLDKIRADVAQSRATAKQIQSQNVLMKEAMSNPYMRDWAPYVIDAFRGR